MSKTICILRPEPYINELSEVLSQHGFSAYALPIQMLKAIPYTQFTRKADIAIFTSQAAVQHAPEFINKRTILVGVGPSTVQAIEKKYSALALMPNKQYSSEGILALPLFQRIADKIIVLYTGKNGRTFLQQKIEQREANLILQYVYERTSIPYTKKQISKALEESDVIVASNVESLERLCSLCDEYQLNALYQKQLLVISERIMEHPFSYKFELPIILAENGSHEAIITALKKRTK